MNVRIMVTRECNLRCSYCYNNHEHVFLQTDVAQEIVNFIVGLKTPVDVSFIGGETFLNFKIIQYIVDALFEADVVVLRLGLITNGTIYSKEIESFLLKYHDILQLHVSLDAPKALHDKNRRFIDGSPSYDIVKKNIIKMLTVYDKLIIEMRYGDSESEVIAAIRELIDMGVHFLKLSPITDKSYSYAQQKEIWYKILDFYVKEVLLCGYYFIITTMFTSETQNFQNKPCGAGRGIFAIDERGDIYPCYLFMTQKKYCLGNVCTLGLSQSQFHFFHYRLLKYIASNNTRHCFASFVAFEGRDTAANMEESSIHLDESSQIEFIREKVAGRKDLLHDMVKKRLF